MASELLSGTITQDGSTYVPQTGRQLQAEAPDLPLPVNSINQPSTSGGPEALEHAGLGAALEYEQFLAAQRATAAGECSQEEAYCGSDPEHGTNIDQCKVGAIVRAEPEDYVTYEGKYHCEYVNVFELQVVLWEQQPNGQYREVVGSGLKGVFHNAFDGSGNKLAHNWECKEGHVFLAWAWGRYWHGHGGKTIWSGDRTALHSATCESPPPMVDVEPPKAE